MASGWDQTVIKNVLDALLGGTTFVATSTGINARLMTVTGSSTSNGTELSTSGGYTAGGQVIVFGAFSTTNTNATYSAPNGQDANTAADTWTNMPAVSSPGVVGVELWDKGGSPARKMWGDLTAAKIVNSGDTFSFAIGAVIGQLAG